MSQKSQVKSPKLSPPEKQIENYVYSFKDHLGSGAFGKHKETSELCAIKAINLKQLEQSDYLLQSLYNEIEIMKKLQGQNIVALIDVCYTTNNVYIIQEFCNRGDLRGFLRKNEGCLSEKQAIQILRHIVSGFKSLVKQNIIHRDLKPENILLHNDLFKLADFGFAKSLNNFSKQQLQSICGTPLYMAPQILKTEIYSTKSDIWSMGLIFYEMLFGKTPWTAKSEYQLIMEIEKKPLQFPYKIQISDMSKDFIKNCLQPSEAKRYSWEQVFNHPLIIQPIDQLIYKEQNGESKLKSLDSSATKFMQKLQYTIKQHQIDVKVLFQALDKDNNLTLDQSEFSRLILSIDKTSSTQQIRHIFNKFDANGDQNISLEEFMHYIYETDYTSYQLNKDPFLESKAQQVIDQLKEIVQKTQIDVASFFEMFSKKQPNLTFNDFSLMLQKLNKNITKVEIEYLFRKLDTDNDKTVSLAEFKEALMNENQTKLEKRIQEQSLTLEKKNSSQIAQKAQKIIEDLKYILKLNADINIKKIFTTFDTEKQGCLNFTQFCQIINILDDNVSEEECRFIFSLFNSKGSEKITFADFERLLG